MSLNRLFQLLVVAMLMPFGNRAQAFRIFTPGLTDTNMPSNHPTQTVAPLASTTPAPTPLLCDHNHRLTSHGIETLHQAANQDAFRFYQQAFRATVKNNIELFTNVRSEISIDGPRPTDTPLADNKNLRQLMLQNMPYLSGGLRSQLNLLKNLSEDQRQAIVRETEERYIDLMEEKPGTAVQGAFHGACGLVGVDRSTRSSNAPRTDLSSPGVEL